MRRNEGGIMLNIKLDRLHTLHLEMHNWVRVDDYIIIKENKNEYYLTQIVGGRWEMNLDSKKTMVEIEEDK